MNKTDKTPFLNSEITVNTEELPHAYEEEEPPALHVQLEGFDGPLDLLLHLVRTQRMDIQSLRLAQITSPYLAHLEQMRALNLEVGGEFLRIAAVLVWMKSKTLLPHLTQTEEEAKEEESLDPRLMEEMLLYRLQRYQQFKESAQWLAACKQLGRDVFARTPPIQDTPSGQQPEALEEASLYGLMSALQNVLKRARSKVEVVISLDAKRIEEILSEVLRKLAYGKKNAFSNLLPAQSGRPEVIAVFLALLELARLGALQLVQQNMEADIVCIPSALLAKNPQKMQQQVLRGFYSAG